LRKDTLTVLAPLAGYSSTSVIGINGRGDIVGAVTSLNGTTKSGFIRDKNGNFTLFSHPDAVLDTTPRGINNSGLVTGYRDSVDSQFAPENGFIYDPKTGTFTDIVPSLFTIAQGINKRGEVVGSSVFEVANDPYPSFGNALRADYGWFRATDGIVTYFEINGSPTRARGIDDEGIIVGFFTDLAGEEITIKGFITELNGPPPCRSITIAADDVIEFPAAIATFPEGINKTGDIVGQYRDSTGNTHGFIATPQ
jgi:uncharacterized membrane protein